MPLIRVTDTADPREFLDVDVRQLSQALWSAPGTGGRSVRHGRTRAGHAAETLGVMPVSREWSPDSADNSLRRGNRAWHQPWLEPTSPDPRPAGGFGRLRRGMIERRRAPPSTLSTSPGKQLTGKPTVAVPLAEALGVPLISEEAIKEALFEAVGIGDWQWSKTLSRAADAALVEIAATLEAPSCRVDGAEAAPAG